MKQSETFLESEGDAWFLRNQGRVAARNLPQGDSLLREILDLPLERSGPVRILEIGCGEGDRLAWLKDHMNAACYGVEPSAKAVGIAAARGLDVSQGTADSLSFDDNSFDIVIFGFCLYLCDRDDLFRIACEADRVLRAPGWLMIKDFYSRVPRSNAYRHYPGLRSYKMDYRTLFTWHPNYECVTHKVRHHDDDAHTDSADDWVATSVLRKFPLSPYEKDERE